MWEVVVKLVVLLVERGTGWVVGCASERAREQLTTDLCLCIRSYPEYHTNPTQPEPIATVLLSQAPHSIRPNSPLQSPSH